MFLKVLYKLKTEQNYVFLKFKHTKVWESLA